ncbi:MAG: hypothetical protein ACE5I1_05645 [bacterium]
MGHIDSRGVKIRLMLFFLVSLAANTAAQTAGVWQTLPNAPVAEDFGRFDDVFFLDAATGWITNVGDAKIIKTNDGGATWTEQIDAQAAFGLWVGFRSIGFANARLGWSNNLNFHNSPVPRRAHQPVPHLRRLAWLCCWRNSI